MNNRHRGSAIWKTKSRLSRTSVHTRGGGDDSSLSLSLWPYCASANWRANIIRETWRRGMSPVLCARAREKAQLSIGARQLSRIPEPTAAKRIVVITHERAYFHGCCCCCCCSRAARRCSPRERQIDPRAMRKPAIRNTHSHPPTYATARHLSSVYGCLMCVGVERPNRAFVYACCRFHLGRCSTDIKWDATISNGRFANRFIQCLSRVIPSTARRCYHSLYASMLYCREDVVSLSFFPW